MVAFVIRAGRTKHGPRSMRKLEYAQRGIHALYPTALPLHVNYLKLARDVNTRLAQEPAYRETGFGKLSPMTVRRALEVLRDANR